MPLCNQIGQHDDSDMQALRTNTQLLSLTLPLNRNARANTRQVEMCTCLVLVVWWSALGEALDGLGVFHLGVLGGCLVWGGFAFGGVWLFFGVVVRLGVAGRFVVWVILLVGAVCGLGWLCFWRCVWWLCGLGWF